MLDAPQFAFGQFYDAATRLRREPNIVLLTASKSIVSSSGVADGGFINDAPVVGCPSNKGFGLTREPFRWNWEDICW